MFVLLNLHNCGSTVKIKGFENQLVLILSLDILQYAETVLQHKFSNLFSNALIDVNICLF